MMSRFTPEQIYEAEQMQAEYQAHIEMLWEDRLFELQMRLGVNDIDIWHLVDEIQ